MPEELLIPDDFFSFGSRAFCFLQVDLLRSVAQNLGHTVTASTNLKAGQHIFQKHLSGQFRSAIHHGK